MKLVNNKKSQIEMFGLVILAVVILIFLLFLLNFMFKSKNISVYDYYESQTLKTTFVSSILQTNTDCDDLAQTTIQSLIESCVQEEGIERLCKDGRNYCEYLNDTLRNIMNYSLRHIEKKYYFVIKTSRGNVYFEDMYNCDTNQTKKLETQPFLIPLPSGRENIQIALFLC
ncbi:MAG: hypothetical protein QXR30_01425 [Candidatus Woesearchaeota archaeon]